MTISRDGDEFIGSADVIDDGPIYDDASRMDVPSLALSLINPTTCPYTQSRRLPCFESLTTGITTTAAADDENEETDTTILTRLAHTLRCFLTEPTTQHVQITETLLDVDPEA